MSSRPPSRQPVIGLTEIVAINFPTRLAEFRLHAFKAVYPRSGGKAGRPAVALALVHGDIHGSPPVVRIHSQCTTGEAFHSLRCDCHDQLCLAMQVIAERGCGVVLYDHQEGRGIGLLEKLRAYELQDTGLDTIDANLQLGHPADARNYELAVKILHFFQIRSLRLMTNNPEKIGAVRTAGIEILERLSASVPTDPHFESYLATKRARMGHLDDLVSADPHADAPPIQFDPSCRDVR